MVSTDKKLANAMGGKTARACDRCIRNRAGWYCASDDVFLCQFCDSMVHSANPLARGHERVRLKLKTQPPSWHQGFTKKSRTPRAKNSNNNKHRSHRIQNPLHLVPEIGSDDFLNAMNSEQYSFSGEFSDMVVPIQADTKDGESEFDLNGLILPSDLELAEFAADVESLLGKSTLDDESFNMERLNDLERVKVEEEVPLELSFDYDYDYLSVAWEEEDGDVEKKVVKKEDEKCEVVVNDDDIIINDDDDDDDDRISSKKNSKMLLKLDYEGIMAAWDDERSPWATGDRPELDSDGCNWLHCMGGCGKMLHCDCGDMGMMMGIGGTTRLDGGREARVSRYREKRRTRLFSKKIRYEVRKLNAEKRPRIKGRFVKRPSTANSLVFPLLTNT